MNNPKQTVIDGQQGVFGGPQNILADDSPPPFLCIGRTSDPLSGVFVDDPQYVADRGIFGVITNPICETVKAGNTHTAVIGAACGSVLLGSNCTTYFNKTILLGDGLTATADNQLIIGIASCFHSLVLTDNEYQQLYDALTRITSRLDCHIKD